MSVVIVRSSVPRSLPAYSSVVMIAVLPGWSACCPCASKLRGLAARARERHGPEAILHVEREGLGVAIHAIAALPAAVRHVPRAAVEAGGRDPPPADIEAAADGGVEDAARRHEEPHLAEREGVARKLGRELARAQRRFLDGRG